MRRLLLILGLLLGACGQPSLSPSPAPATAGLAEATATLPATAEATTPLPAPEVGPGRLYVMGTVLFSDPYLQRLAAYDPVNGTHYFSLDLPDGGTLYPAPDGAVLYIMGQKQLLALDARDGHTLWTWTDDDYSSILGMDTQHIYLQRPLRVQTEIVRTDLLALDLATREMRLVGTMPPCNIYAVAATALVCAHSEFIVTEPGPGNGTVEAMDLTTGARTSYSFNYQIVSMNLRPGTSEVWVQEQPLDDSGILREPLPADITVLDVLTGERRELTLPPLDDPPTISRPDLFFTPDGNSVTLFRNGSVLQFATPAFTLRTETPVPKLGFGRFLLWQNGAGFLVVDDSTNSLQPWSINQGVPARWKLANMTLGWAVLAPVPPGPPLVPSPPPASLAPETIGSGRFPPPPVTGLETLQAIADWLSADPTHLDALDDLMFEWMQLYGDIERRAGGGGIGSHTRLNGDVDGDGEDEIVIAWLPPKHWLEPVSGGSEIIFGVLDWDGTRYQVLDQAIDSAFDAPYGVPRLAQLADLTGDGRDEIVMQWESCGASNCFSSPQIIQLQPDALHPLLMTEAYTPADDLEPDVKTSNSEFALVDLEGDGVLEFQQTAGSSGSNGGCCSPAATATYAWNGVDFRLTSVEYAPNPQDAYLQLIEGTRLFRDDRYAEAYDRYQQALVPQNNLLRFRSEPQDWTIVDQVARFQLMVTALLLERPDDAVQWRDSLTEPLDQQWAAQFWTDYTATGDVATACTRTLANPLSERRIEQTGTGIPAARYVCRFQ